MSVCERKSISAFLCLGFVAIVVSGCGKLAEVPKFSRAKISAALASQVSLNSWGSSYLIDAGTSNVNNDTSSTCLDQFDSGSEGCQIAPPVLYSDNRWFIGFSQDYVQTSGQVKFSLFASISNLTTGLFGALGFGLGLIDTGLGVNGVATESSSRYVQFAKFSNGDVIAVYMIEQAGPVRTVYATIYKAATKTWSTAFQLGSTGYNTDRGSDYFDTNDTADDMRSQYLCRPSVATSGNAAMVAWCEDIDNAAVDPKSVIKYAVYSNGVWNITAGNPNSVVTEGATLYAFPGFSGQVSSFKDATFADGDLFELELFNGGASIDIATSSAADQFAGSGQFNISYDSSNNVQGCETLQNLFTSLLEVPTRFKVGFSLTGYTLASRGLSIELNPLCDDADSTTWFGIAYFNKALKPLYRNITANSKRPFQIRKITDNPATAAFPDTIVEDYDYDTVFAKTTINIPSQLLISSGNQVEWLNHSRSAWVDVAGDGSGNFLMVRSGVAPVFKNTIITPSTVATDVDLVGLAKGRMLFGHQYTASSGWKMDPTTTTEPLTALISNPPSCDNGVDNFACSIKNPKVLMSENGHGLIFFYQQQSSSYQVCSGSTDCNKNPNRLWYASYSSATGFSSIANILDQDVVCNSSSYANDSSVCEVSSYSNACGYINAEGNLDVGKIISTTRSQYFNSPTDTTSQAIDHDIKQIPAAINKTGKAIVAYHKNISTGSVLSPSCSLSLTSEYYIGLYVHRYDPVTGFGNAEQLDDGTGFTMNASVAISNAGKMAVVWEQLFDSGAVYVYLRTYDGSSWSTAKLINDGYTDPVKTMMPSVGINESGDINVTFTYGPAAGIRRQYVRQYRSL